MPDILAPATQDDVKARILIAAQARFERYGFNKTTMAEIAGDCNMSAANLYRYFNSKGAIAASGAARWFGDAERLIAAAGRSDDASPRDRLLAVVHTKLRLVADVVARHPHLDELVGHMCAERPDLIADHLRAVQSVIADVLRDGVGAGLFDVPDIDATAATILVATQVFQDHSWVRCTELEKLEAQATDVVALLVRGLSAARDNNMRAIKRP